MSNKKNKTLEKTEEKCRKGCGACCIAPSISSALPGLKAGKPAGHRCLHLSKENLCSIFNSPLRPAVCREFSFTKEICGENFEEAMQNITRIETLTTPD